MPRTHELGLFRAEGTRKQPRDQRGRFMCVRYTPERLKIFEVARQLRAERGMAPSPFLSPYTPKSEGSQ